MKIFTRQMPSNLYLKEIKQKNIWWLSFISLILLVVREQKELAPPATHSKKVLVSIRDFLLSAMSLLL